MKEAESARKLRIAAENKLREQQRINDFASRGYVFVTVKSLEKYIAVIDTNLLSEMNNATMSGCSKMFVHKDTLEVMENKLKAHKEKNKKLSQCASLNNKGMAYEEEGKISLAIKTYEKNIQSDCPAHHSFKRLMILYRKNKDYENERRVILRSLEVFPGCQEYIDRLNKVEKLVNNV